MDDEEYEGVVASAGPQAVKIMEALEVQEVREALEAWAEVNFNMIRALERAGLERHTIAGIMGGGIIDTLQKMAEE